MEGENGERKNRCLNEIVCLHVNETDDYLLEGTPIHARCLNKLLKDTADPSDVDRLFRAIPIKKGRSDLKCYYCQKYLHEEPGCH